MTFPFIDGCNFCKGGYQLNCPKTIRNDEFVDHFRKQIQALLYLIQSIK